MVHIHASTYYIAFAYVDSLGTFAVRVGVSQNVHSGVGKFLPVTRRTVIGPREGETCPGPTDAINQATPCGVPSTKKMRIVAPRVCGLIIGTLKLTLPVEIGRGHDPVQDAGGVCRGAGSHLPWSAPRSLAGDGRPAGRRPRARPGPRSAQPARRCAQSGSPIRSSWSCLGDPPCIVGEGTGEGDD
jgi:hypothetical protein